VEKLEEYSVSKLSLAKRLRSNIDYERIEILVMNIIEGVMANVEVNYTVKTIETTEKHKVFIHFVKYGGVCYVLSLIDGIIFF